MPPVVVVRPSERRRNDPPAVVEEAEQGASPRTSWGDVRRRAVERGGGRAGCRVGPPCLEEVDKAPRRRTRLVAGKESEQRPPVVVVAGGHGAAPPLAMVGGMLRQLDSHDYFYVLE